MPDGKMQYESRSSPREIQHYLGRISGPWLDRIDIHIEDQVSNGLLEWQPVVDIQRGAGKP